MRILLVLLMAASAMAQTAVPKTAVVLRAARLLDIENGRIVSPGEVLVRGDRIVASGTHVDVPAGARVIELGDRTLMPGLIDAHVHLFLHPGNEGLQTVEESVPERTISATLAARDDLLAGFTAERDMGTEGAGPADTAVREAIDRGEIPGPRLRVSGNAIDITGGHEDAIGFNPEQRVLSNATYADSAEEIVRVMRQQRKEGADFTKIYETGKDRLVNGDLVTPAQFTEVELAAAVAEARRTGSVVAVHCMGEPGALWSAEAGVASIDHAAQLSPETMRLMREKQIYAVPTFAVFEYFAQHAASAEAAAREQALLDFHRKEFAVQRKAGVPFAVGSDVGPFPHGTQARELELMVEYGMPAMDVLRADLVNGAKLLQWPGEIGTLQPGAYADVIAVAGNPAENIRAVEQVEFVMKGGVIYKFTK